MSESDAVLSQRLEEPWGPMAALCGGWMVVAVGSCSFSLTCAAAHYNHLLKHRMSMSVVEERCVVDSWVVFWGMFPPWADSYCEDSRRVVRDTRTSFAASLFRPMRLPSVVYQLMA